MIACERIVHFRSQEKDALTGELVSKVHPRLEGYLSVNVCSNSTHWKNLSPMKLGPLKVVESKAYLYDYPRGILPGSKVVSMPEIENEYNFSFEEDEVLVISATNLENYWQGSKCFEVDLDEEGYVTTKFFQRRAKLMADPKPHRRALPKSQGMPIISYFNARLWSYLESRPIYCTLYEKLVVKTNEFKKLKKLHEKGENLLILGFDGQKMQVTPEKLNQAYLDLSKPFGHELVLCSLLLDHRPWMGEDYFEKYGWLLCNYVIKEKEEEKEKINKSQTTRVRIRRKAGKIVQDCDVYVGRRMTQGGWNLAASPFANPFKCDKKSDNRDEVVEKYEEYLRNNEELLQLLPTLQGKVLGCWCEAHEKCHADVIIKVLGEILELEASF